MSTTVSRAWRQPLDCGGNVVYLWNLPDFKRMGVEDFRTRILLPPPRTGKSVSYHLSQLE